MNYEIYHREITSPKTGENPDTHTLQMTSRNLDYEHVQASLVRQLREYCEQAGQNGYVVGVSGGVDSAVVSTLCAMTGLPVTVVEMPIHQKSEEITRARHHTKWLQATFPNVTRKTHDLTNVFEVFSREIEAVGQGKDTYLALVNTRSRIRMILLYAIGNTGGLLVAGTGNRVEDYGIGFFTKYGDGGVDVSPIGNLYKSEVRALGRSIGIAPLLTEAVATDGLHPDGATDTDQIGATYEELEWAMEQYDCGKRADDFMGRAHQVMKIYTERHLNNAHKTAPIPVFNFPLGNTQS